MHARPLALALSLLACLTVTACGSGGGSSDDGASGANALVDPDGDIPTVFELSGVPGSSAEMLLSTNRGLFKVAAGKARPMRATVTAEGTTADVGKTMALTVEDDRTLIGSGHPNDEASPLPTELGVLRSEDGGATWEPVARLGEADLHFFVVRHDRIYGWDAILGAVLVSEDDGKTFTEGITPPGPVLDMAVDPKDPDTIVITGETAAFRSEDGGETWRPLTSATDARVAWLEDGTLVRADSDGSVHQSRSGGESFEQVGSVEDQPQDFHVTEDGTLHLATSSGSIFRSSDAGRTWQAELEA